jgi:hypothetical protein
VAFYYITYIVYKVIINYFKKDLRSSSSPGFRKDTLRTAIIIILENTLWQVTSAEIVALTEPSGLCRFSCLQNYMAICSTWYWVLSILQVCYCLSVFSQLLCHQKQSWVFFNILYVSLDLHFPCNKNIIVLPSCIIWKEIRPTSIITTSCYHHLVLQHTIYLPVWYVGRSRCQLGWPCTKP